MFDNKLIVEYLCQTNMFEYIQKYLFEYIQNIERETGQ